MLSKKFKIGDLVFVSRFGKSVLKPNPAKVGIIIAGPHYCMYQCVKSDAHIKYSTYDVMFGGELLNDMPEDFLERMGDDEHVENPQQLEEIFERNGNEGRPQSEQIEDSQKDG